MVLVNVFPNYRRNHDRNNYKFVLNRLCIFRSLESSIDEREIMIVPKIVVWLLLGYVGGWIFAKKGYPPKLGIVIGILLGPIAIALCAVLPRTREGREQAALERSKRCPICDRELGVSARVCPRCEHRFEAA